eukprot:12195914-Ditylum_brightwellii.AAC.1
MLQHMNTGTVNTADALRRLGRDRPTPTLSVPTWSSNKKFEWLNLLLSRIQQCPYFQVLYDNTAHDLTRNLANTHQEEDNLLSNKLLR